MGIADEEEEGGRTFPVFCKYVSREEDVEYEEVHVGSGFAVQTLECFGLSRAGLSSWRALAGANCCQQCVSQHCLRTRDPAGSQLQALRGQAGNSCPLLLQSGGGYAEPSPDPKRQQEESHWLQ